jgi:hypothetical protein
VENPVMTIESFNRQFQLGEKESCYAMRHAPCAMRFSIPGRPSLRDYQPRRVIGCRRLGNGIGDGEIKNRGYPLGKKFVYLSPRGYLFVKIVRLSQVVFEPTFPSLRPLL